MTGVAFAWLHLATGGLLVNLFVTFSVRLHGTVSSRNWPFHSGYKTVICESLAVFSFVIYD